MAPVSHPAAAARPPGPRGAAPHAAIAVSPGAIDAGELSIAMQALGFNPSTSEIAKMMRDIDTDGNATVEFPEFIEMMEGKMVRGAAPLFSLSPVRPTSALRSTVARRRERTR